MLVQFKAHEFFTGNEDIYGVIAWAFSWGEDKDPSFYTTKCTSAT